MRNETSPGSRKDGFDTNRSRKEKFIKGLRPSKQTETLKKIAGFDIETCDDNKTFICASIVNNEHKEFVTDKNALINRFKDKRWRNHWIFACNLGFDFFGSFFGSDQIEKFRLIFRGSDLIAARTYIYDNDFHATPEQNKRGSNYLIFIDTLNYAKLSVEQLGKIIGHKKLEKPAFLGKMPANYDEWRILKEYNLNDSIITHKFGEFFQESLRRLGGDLKYTIASTAMKLFRNRYLDRNYIVHEENVLLDIFKAYYGGRTEVFKRGESNEVLYYHDFNSMYPYIMSNNVFPDPNSLRSSKRSSAKIIMDHDGVSDVTIIVPKMSYPPLPYRYKEKLIFPCGELSGWYSHIELRYALSLGCRITEYRNTHYYIRSCRPFLKYVEDLYNKRLQFKADNNPMEIVTKLLLNSLYGKFGQRFDNMKETKHVNQCTITDMQQEHIQIGDYVVINKKNKPFSFSIPIWSVYVTGYGRIMMHDKISKHNAVYCDTDSIICKDKIEHSSMLGGLKIEHVIIKSCFVRPKMYAFTDFDGIDHVKCKGIHVPWMKYTDFVAFLKDFKINQVRFTKFKTAIRRSLAPNQLTILVKNYQVNDDKRVWERKKFDKDDLQESEPFVILAPQCGQKSSRNANLIHKPQTGQ